MADDDPNDDLERRLDRTLRALPLRRAPAALESRVLAELERRAALPWWRRRFDLWPLHARALFVALCGGLAGAIFLGGAVAVDRILALPWTHPALRIMDSTAHLVVLAARYSLAAHYALPAWVYGAIAICAVLYGILFGLGAVVYRSVYLHSTAGAR